MRFLAAARCAKGGAWQTKNRGREVKLQRVEGHSEERFLGSDVFQSDGAPCPPRGGGTV